jgi:hypothetical protein
MRRQACRVDSFCDHSMPEETHPVRGRLLRDRSREASEEAKFACTRTPVSGCSDCRTRSLLFVEVRVPGLMKRAYECWRYCWPEHPSFAGC